jgi:hypothetical protein
MLLLGLHMPKCGGTTVLQRALSLLPFNTVYQCTHFVRNFRENRMEFAHLNNYGQLKLLFGHQLHEEMLKLMPGPVGLFTGLREPRSRLKSHLIFLRSLRLQQGLPPLDMEAEVVRRSNGLCKFLNSRFPSLAGEGSEAERAFRVLEHFWCVYFIDRFDETTGPIFEHLNIEPEKISWNIGAPAKSGEEDDIDISHAQLDEDMILYERAAERFCVQRPLCEESGHRIARFRAEPFRAPRLRKFLYAASYQQFRDAGMLDQVIAHRKRMITELEAELDRYEKLGNRKRALQPDNDDG